MKQFILPLFMILCLVGFVNAQIEIDGDMLDWDNVPRADIEGAAESLGDMVAGKDYDLNSLYVTGNDSMFFMRITIDPTGSLVTGYSAGLALEIYLDTDIANSSGLNWGWWTLGLDYLIDISGVAAGGTEATILANIQRDLDSPAWPDGWDSVGVAMVAMNEGATEVEVGIPLELLDAWHNIRPWVHVVGAWDWANPDGMPNGQFGWDPAYMIDYNIHTRTASVYEANGAQIEDAIEIDGDMLDWSGLSNVDKDPVAEEIGDMETGPDFDVMDWWMASDSNYVYVRIDIDPTGTFSGQWTKYAADPVFQLQFESIMSDTVGLSWGNWWHMGGDYLINLTDAYNPDSPQDSVTLWEFIGDYEGAVEEYDSIGVCAVAVDENDNKLEIAVPRAMIHADGSEVRPFVYSVGNENWDVEEYFPNDITAEEGPAYVLSYNFMTGAEAVQVMSGPTAIGRSAIGDTPERFALDQNYPNPFNPTTNIRFTLPVADQVNIVVFDVLGRKVATLASNQSFSASTHVVSWNGLNDAGNRVGSGVYFYQITTSQYSATKKMILMK